MLVVIHTRLYNLYIWVQTYCNMIYHTPINIDNILVCYTFLIIYYYYYKIKYVMYVLCNAQYNTCTYKCMIIIGPSRGIPARLDCERLGGTRAFRNGCLEWHCGTLHVPAMFFSLVLQSTGHQSVTLLFQYVISTWLSNLDQFINGIFFKIGLVYKYRKNIPRTQKTRFRNESK